MASVIFIIVGLYFLVARILAIQKGCATVVNIVLLQVDIIPESEASRIRKQEARESKQEEGKMCADFGRLWGYNYIKRALEVAVAGAHSILIVSGENDLAIDLVMAVRELLPPFTETEIQKIAFLRERMGEAIYIASQRPFVVIEGRYSNIKQYLEPRENWCYGGVIFAPDFSALKDRRRIVQYSESRKATMRVRGREIEIPVSFTLIAMMKPCRCGNWTVADDLCNCRATDIIRYYQNSVPKDSFHIAQKMSPSSRGWKDSYDSFTGWTERVMRAREVQASRPIAGICNSDMSDEEIDKWCVSLLTPDAKKLLTEIQKERWGKNKTRAMLVVSRTIADLEEKDFIEVNHVAEAIHYAHLLAWFEVSVGGNETS